MEVSAAAAGWPLPQTVLQPALWPALRPALVSSSALRAVALHE
jgi:hypothetical protein